MERCQEECSFPHQHQHLFIWMILRVLEVSVDLPPKAHVLKQCLVCGPSLCWAGADLMWKREMLVLLCLLLLKENSYWPVLSPCQSLENVSVTGLPPRVKLWQPPWFLWIKKQNRSPVIPSALELLSSNDGRELEQVTVIECFWLE